MAHEHGPHECYCPSCGFTMMAAAGQICSSVTCPTCGGRMRATETGEYRVSQEPVGATMAPIVVVGLLGFLVWGLARKH